MVKVLVVIYVDVGVMVVKVVTLLTVVFLLLFFFTFISIITCAGGKCDSSFSCISS